ncbi:MAG: hypothetical protein PHV85_08000, partial [Desulfovibrionaceae bacterium]|nr:hypothetical protein [Desulfovibrionaceae bacterium]
MSTELITARKKISSVGTLLKQKRHMPAVQSLHDALIMVLKHTLMRSERDEFERMIAQAVDTLNNDKGLRQLYPLIIRYNPGKEKELLEAMRELLVELQRVVTENAQQDLAELERRKQEGL